MHFVTRTYSKSLKWMRGKHPEFVSVHKYHGGYCNLKMTLEDGTVFMAVFKSMDDLKAFLNKPKFRDVEMSGEGTVGRWLAVQKAKLTFPTVRQLLNEYRKRDKTRLYKSCRPKGCSKTMIVSKPDFSIVPYDKIKDYWAFVDWHEPQKTLYDYFPF